MTAERRQDRWDVVLRPYWTPRFAYVAALLIIAAHIAGGLLLKVGSSGVVFRTADQMAMAALGLILAGAVLLLTRPRLRVGPAGLSLRNVLGDKLIPWTDVVGVSFPGDSRWAQVDLPDDEYIPVLAIQAVDKERAVAAMDTVRSLLVRYQPGQHAL
ncbi:PH domain-containing protein [Mycobacterium simiae]|uniref:PH domain-containing protein n=1 Tax=Mycobacterium simiae TaxID=1784 RepID=A0A5B1BMP6_MYCSI|nr:PH domain-containing protein [Mycobacterium simiae]KAA1248504.1 PH domain-containing protein [Mycobacterium simiae]